MQPPEAGAASSMPRSARCKSGIGKAEALDQDADESAVGFAAAINGPLAKIAHLNPHHERIARRGYACAAFVTAHRKIGHFAEAFARPEHRKQLLVLGHAHFALDHDAKEIAGITFAHAHGSGGHPLP